MHLEDERRKNESEAADNKASVSGMSGSKQRMYACKKAPGWKCGRHTGENDSPCRCLYEKIIIFETLKLDGATV